MSWIGLPDLVELIIWSMETSAIRGPVNAVAPQPVTQAEFAHTLGAVLRRPSSLPMPGWVASMIFGQMGRETVLSDLAVYPSVALKGGFRFGTPDLDSALRQAIRE
jgi:NAD dependent epimerase/dehydratase family enzyme